MLHSALLVHLGFPQVLPHNFWTNEVPRLYLSVKNGHPQPFEETKCTYFFSAAWKKRESAATRGLCEWSAPGARDLLATDGPGVTYTCVFAGSASTLDQAPAPQSASIHSSAVLTDRALIHTPVTRSLQSAYGSLMCVQIAPARVRLTFDSIK